MEACGSWSHHHGSLPRRTIKFDVCVRNLLLNLEFTSSTRRLRLYTSRCAGARGFCFAGVRSRPDIQPPVPLPFVPMPAENRTRSSEESNDLAQVSRGKSAASTTPTQRRSIFIFGWRAYTSSPSWPGPCNSAVRLQEITIPKCHPS